MLSFTQTVTVIGEQVCVSQNIFTKTWKEVIMGNFVP